MLHWCPRRQKSRKRLCNALMDLGASISVMPFSMFKRLGLGSHKLISMVIKIADRSMQSLKGIVENILVIIDKFIFLVDFVILDIMEDNKVPDYFGEPKNLEEFLINDDINGDLRDFLEENDLLLGIDMDSFGVLSDSDNEMGIGLEDLGEGIEDFLDARDPMITTN
ncbi:hypothetical protein Tco_0046145 [Tanacetum coccineum]